MNEKETEAAIKDLYAKIEDLKTSNDANERKLNQILTALNNR